MLLEFWFTDGYEMMHKAWSSIEKMPYCFSRSSIKFQGHTGPKKMPILNGIGHFHAVIPVEFTDGFEMMHKAWRGIEEAPIIFRGHPSNFKIIWAKKIDDLNPIWLRLPGQAQLWNPLDLPYLKSYFSTKLSFSELFLHIPVLRPSLVLWCLE